MKHDRTTGKIKLHNMLTGNTPSLPDIYCDPYFKVVDAKRTHTHKKKQYLSKTNFLKLLSILNSCCGRLFSYKTLPVCPESFGKVVHQQPLKTKKNGLQVHISYCPSSLFFLPQNWRTISLFIAILVQRHQIFQ